MLRPTDALGEHPPIGRVYLPTGSYAEMGEWSLPLEARREFTPLLHDGRVEQDKPEARWMRGGFWRIFQVNYREVNDLHKQMLRTSRKVAALDAGAVGGCRGAGDASSTTSTRASPTTATGTVSSAASTCRHMRLATLEHLIAAEDAADRAAWRSPACTHRRASRHRRGRLRRVAQSARPARSWCIKPNEGGGIGSWDIRAARHALTSVMRRRPEAYHDTLIAHESGDAGLDGQQGMSIDQEVRVVEEGLSRRLWYDDYERRSALVRFLPPDVSLESLEQAQAVELGDFVAGPFAIIEAREDRVVLERVGEVMQWERERVPVRVTKTFALEPDRLSPALTLSLTARNEGSRPLDARLASEWSLNMLGGGGNPLAWIEAEGERQAFDTQGAAAATARLAMGNDGIGISLHSEATPSADIWWYSIETISLSEQGFERNHQGSCMLWTWPLHLEAGQTATFELSHRVISTVDRALDEGL